MDINMQELRKILQKRFNSTEIRNLLFDLNFDYDNYMTEQRDEMILDVLNTLKKHERLDEVVAWIQKNRTDIDLKKLTDSMIVRASELMQIEKEAEQEAGQDQNMPGAPAPQLTQPQSITREKSGPLPPATINTDKAGRFQIIQRWWQPTALACASLLTIALGFTTYNALFASNEPDSISTPKEIAGVTETAPEDAIATTGVTQEPTTVPTDVPTDVPTEEATTVALPSPSSTPTVLPTVVPTELPPTATPSPTELPPTATVPLPTETSQPTPAVTEEATGPIILSPKNSNGASLYPSPFADRDKRVGIVHESQTVTIIAKERTNNHYWLFVEVVGTEELGWAHRSNFDIDDEVDWTTVPTDPDMNAVKYKVMQGNDGSLED